VSNERLEEIAARLLVIEAEAMRVAELAHVLFQDIIDMSRADDVD
jgi:hypothetical protein